MESLSRMTLYQIGCWGSDPVPGLSSEIQSFWPKTRPTNGQRVQGPPQPSCREASSGGLWKHRHYISVNPNLPAAGMMPADSGPAFPSHLLVEQPITRPDRCDCLPWKKAALVVGYPSGAVAGTEISSLNSYTLYIWSDILVLLFHNQTEQRCRSHGRLTLRSAPEGETLGCGQN